MPAAQAAARTAKHAILISYATPAEIPEIVNFTTTARRDMFPMIDDPSHKRQADRELSTFHRTYLEHPDGAFLVARLDDVLVATIGCVAYDDRFPQLQLGPRRVAEVVRLYVEPSLRRTGLASRLFAALVEAARKKGLEQLYLHTHPFLPGAVTFWERHGFSVIYVDEDDLVWRTIHMRLLLAGDRNLEEF